MLTLRSTLNRIWGTYSSPEMSIKALFTHYAYPTKVAHFFHLGRTHQQEAQQALTLMNDYGTTLPDDRTELLKSLYMVTAVCALTPARNPAGELQHRLNYIGEKMQWRIEYYGNAVSFQQALNAQINKLASPNLDLEREAQGKIKDTLTKLLTPDALGNQKNRVVIVDDNQRLIAIGYQNRNDDFIFEPVIAAQQHEHQDQDDERDALRRQVSQAFNQ